MNHVSYFEIHVAEPTRAIAFYAGAFGWVFDQVEGLPSEYWRIATPGMNGGLMRRVGTALPPGTAVSGFVCSIEVASFDETAERIVAHGGTVALPKFAVPGLCWQGYFLDTENNMFGVFQPDPTAS